MVAILAALITVVGAASLAATGWIIVQSLRLAKAVTVIQQQNIAHQEMDELRFKELDRRLGVVEVDMRGDFRTQNALLRRQVEGGSGG